MREIKFRAYDNYHKKMLYQDSITLNGELEPYHEQMKHFLMITKDPSSSVKNYTEWQQYTGLKDKNGTEIYEGDIIAQWYDYEDDENRFVVNWAEPVNLISSSPVEDTLGFVFDKVKGVYNHKDFKQCYFCQRTQIIGNIYENPELLK